ncbi:hydroxyacid dehydrogenase [Serratia sp. Leaf50]|nr:hydroxyacid dehydrogenase [Serratia sp. Leaf50]
MKIVTLDAGTLPTALLKPTWCDHWVYLERTTEEDIVKALAGAEIAITNKVPLRAETLRGLPALRYICVAATGYDCVDIDYCREKGIAVSNVPGYSTQSVAESVIGSIFALRRRLIEYQLAAVNEWSEAGQFCLHKQPIGSVQQATLGIVGKGEIGRAVARMANALGMEAIFAEHKGAEVIREGYRRFEEVIAESDILTLHCPLTPMTKNLIDGAVMANMKTSALLINTARGALIDEAALADALRAQTLAGAALDVLSAEPPPPSHPLLDASLANLIITPHIAWANESGSINLNKGINYNLAGYFSGKIKNRVNA